MYRNATTSICLVNRESHLEIFEWLQGFEALLQPFIAPAPTASHHRHWFNFDPTSRSIRMFPRTRAVQQLFPLNHLIFSTTESEKDGFYHRR